MRTFFLLGLVILQVSCSSFAESEKAAQLSFASISKIEVGRTKKEQISSILGNPHQVSDIENSQIVWIYFDGKPSRVRATLIFNKLADVPSTINWFVKKNEKLANPEKAKNNFPSAVFVEREISWDKTHAQPDIVVYADVIKGLEIIVSRNLNIVNSIRWFDAAETR